MQTKVTLTNTTAAVAVLSHADIVRVLGLAVAVDAGLRIDAPGTLITADLNAAEADGEFTARVAVLIDHNFVPSKPDPVDGQGGGAGTGTGGPSLNPGAGQPATPPSPQPGAGAPAPGGLQIPGAA